MSESDFDGWLLLSQDTKLKSRNDVSTKTQITRKIQLDVPILASPMNTVCEYDLAYAMAETGALGIVHRYLSAQAQADIIKKLIYEQKKHYTSTQVTAASIGVNNVDERIKLLADAGVSILTLDVAHGGMQSCHELTKYIKKNYPDIGVISANIVSKESAHKYYDADIDAIRTGIGSGSGCSTRTVARIGRNQLETIQELHQDNPDAIIIADGGCRQSGDIAACLAAGASAVMAGKLFSVAKESPAKRVWKFKGWKLKRHVLYAGMASSFAEKMRIDRTGEDEKVIDHLKSPEGKVVYLEYQKQSVRDIIEQLQGGIKHAMAYIDAKTISDMPKKARWVRAEGNLNNKFYEGKV